MISCLSEYWNVVVYVDISISFRTCLFFSVKQESRCSWYFAFQRRLPCTFCILKTLYLKTLWAIGNWLRRCGPNAVLCNTYSVLLCILEQPRVDNSSVGPIVLCKTCSGLLCVLEQPRADNSSAFDRLEKTTWEPDER